MPKTLDPNAVLTTPQACRMLGVTRQTLYLWIERKKITPWMMVGGASWLFQRKDVERLQGERYKHFPKAGVK